MYHECGLLITVEYGNVTTDWTTGVRFGQGFASLQTFFSFPLRPHRLWGLLSLLFNGYREVLSQSWTEACNWRLTSVWCRDKEFVELYLHALYVFMAQCLVKDQGQRYQYVSTLKHSCL